MALESKVRFVCVSDTHNHAPGEGFTLPQGDVLIHAGDLTNHGTPQELERALKWLSQAEFAVKLVVAGNHDLGLRNVRLAEEDKESSFIRGTDQTWDDLISAYEPSLTYIRHSSRTIQLSEKRVAFKVFASPYSLDTTGDGKWAFQYNDSNADSYWNKIPADMDVLITHTAPFGICDASRHWIQGGCRSLVRVLERTRPALHVCGHFHEGRGAARITWPTAQSGGQTSQAPSVSHWHDPGKGNKKQSLLDLTGKASKKLSKGSETAIVNASISAQSHGRQGTRAFNKPIVVDLLIAHSCTAA